MELIERIDQLSCLPELPGPVGSLLHEVRDAIAHPRGGPAVAAIEFSLNTDHGDAFLRAWLHGDFEKIRSEWPECPGEVFPKDIPAPVGLPQAHQTQTDPAHMLKPDWVAPVPPEGWTLVATLTGTGGNAAWDMDFLNQRTARFASEGDSAVDFGPWPQYPWIDGFQPQPKDWMAIGVKPLW